MSQALERILGAFVIADDMLVCGKGCTEAEAFENQNTNLDAVLNR